MQAHAKTMAIISPAFLFDLKRLNNPLWSSRLSCFSCQIRWLVKANTPKKGQISIWLFGLIIFFDDYSNTLIVGNTSRLLCDKLGISREKLAYLVDSTSAPVATIAVITTWIGFQISIISDSIETIGGISESAYLLFINSIAYSFYPFLAIFLVGLVVTLGKDFGPMVEAEILARKNKNRVVEETKNNSGDNLMVKDNISYNAINAVSYTHLTLPTNREV